MQFAVRSERFRLVGSTQIFDIDADPGEKINLIKEYPEQAELMLAAYHAWWDEVRPLMVNEDVPLSPTHPFHILYEEQKVRTGILVWNPTSTLKEL
jgi:arylsulfatase